MDFNDCIEKRHEANVKFKHRNTYQQKSTSLRNSDCEKNAYCINVLTLSEFEDKIELYILSMGR